MQYSYDANGRLERVTDVDLHTIDYTHDINGYLATINDQRGVTIVTNQYDELGRVTHQWDGDNNETVFTYGGRAENETVITRTVTVEGERDVRILEAIHAHGPDYKKQLAVEESTNPKSGIWLLEFRAHRNHRPQRQHDQVGIRRAW